MSRGPISTANQTIRLSALIRPSVRACLYTCMRVCVCVCCVPGYAAALYYNDGLWLAAEATFGEKNILEFRTLHVGGYLHSGEEIPHFVGQLQQIWFNGYPYLEIARSAGTHQTAHQGLTPIIRVTGKFGKRNHPVHHPVTFTSKHTYVGLPVLKAYVETNIYFQVGTFPFMGGGELSGYRGWVYGS